MPSIKFHLKNFKKKDKQLREDEVSIYGIVTKSAKERFEIRVGEKILPRHWDFKSQQVKTTHPRYHKINLLLSKIKTDLLILHDEHRNKPFSEFKKLATGESEEKKTLLQAFSKFLTVYKAEKDHKTWAKYNALFTHLKNFGHTDLKTLDYEFYHSFKTFLFSVPNPNYRNCSILPDRSNLGDYYLSHDDTGDIVGLFDDTVYKYIINLKTFCSWAVERGYQVHPSFKKWEVIQRKHKPITLTLAELERLENFFFTYESVKPFTKNRGEAGKVAKALDIARDYLVFECRTGQRISDIKRFDLKDFHDSKWTFNPRKGNRLSSKTCTVHFSGFCAPALNILVKHNWKMPVVAESNINENIKTACKVVGINQEIDIYRWSANKRIRISMPKYEHISTHSGKKTFVTIALQYMNPKIVKDLANINSWSTLKHYEGSSETSAIEQDLDKVPTTKTVMKKAN